MYPKSWIEIFAFPLFICIGKILFIIIFCIFKYWDFLAFSSTETRYQTYIFMKFWVIFKTKIKIEQMDKVILLSEIQLILLILDSQTQLLLGVPGS